MIQVLPLLASYYVFNQTRGHDITFVSMIIVSTSIEVNGNNNSDSDQRMKAFFSGKVNILLKLSLTDAASIIKFLKKCLLGDDTELWTIKLLLLITEKYARPFLITKQLKIKCY